MIEIILTFPVRRAPTLSRVWFETGNPAQPLACKWIASEQTESCTRSASVAALRLCRLCVG
jgi:hypothetical protein